MEFRLEHRRYNLPFRQPFVTSRGAWANREGVFVRVTKADGSAGYGEAAPVPHLGRESAEADEAACGALGGRIRDLTQVPVGLPSLRGALASALETVSAPARHRSLGVAALLSSGKAALAEAPVQAEAGFRVFKWKVGVGAAGDELSMLDDLLGRLPGGCRIRLDANRAWDRRTAERWLAAASERPVEFVEEPVGDVGDREDCLRGLAADYPVPIGLDESLTSEVDVLKWLEGGWKGYFVIKMAVIEGAHQALEHLRGAQARVVFSSAMETAIGAQVALRTAFSWTGKVAALGYGVWPLFADVRFDGPPPAPLLRIDDVNRIDPEVLWNAVR